MENFEASLKEEPSYDPFLWHMKETNQSIVLSFHIFALMTCKSKL